MCSKPCGSAPANAASPPSRRSAVAQHSSPGRESGPVTWKGALPALACPGCGAGVDGASGRAGPGPGQPAGPDDPASYSSSGTSPRAQAFSTGSTIRQQSSAVSPRTDSSGSPVQDALQDFAVGQQVGGAQLGLQGDPVQAEDVARAVDVDVELQGVRPEADPELVGGVHAR